ncbi:MAG: hypothetical protein QOK06_2916, partial [Acidimicrobiaceae bacterium]
MKQPRPTAQGGSLVSRNCGFVEPKGVADSHNDGRMLKKGLQYRERKHLFVTDKYGGALMVDLENSG